jgi:hypothetical protein
MLQPATPPPTITARALGGTVIATHGVIAPPGPARKGLDTIQYLGGAEY